MVLRGGRVGASACGQAQSCSTDAATCVRLFEKHTWPAFQAVRQACDASEHQAGGYKGAPDDGDGQVVVHVQDADLPQVALDHHDHLQHDKSSHAAAWHPCRTRSLQLCAAQLARSARTALAKAASEPGVSNPETAARQQRDCVFRRAGMAATRSAWPAALTDMMPNMTQTRRLGGRRCNLWQPSCTLDCWTAILLPWLAAAVTGSMRCLNEAAAS
jgi:hypothetical protein